MTTVDLDPKRHVEILTGQRQALLGEVAALRERLMDLEIILDALTVEPEEAADADA